MSWLDRFRGSGAGDASPASSPAADDPATAAIVERLRRFLSEHSETTLRPADIDPRQQLFDAGYVDSLSATALLAFVHSEYGVRIVDMDLVDRCSTLEGLAAFIVAGGAR
jgi:D-alanine--poly(phosphoribitol) ligase subunit 2